MQARQDEVMAAFQEKQAGLVMSLKESQETLYAATNRLQEQLSTPFHAQQLAAIAQMQTAQDQTLQKVADYQLQSINSLTRMSPRTSVAISTVSRAGLEALDRGPPTCLSRPRPMPTKYRMPSRCSVSRWRSSKPV